MPVVLIVRKKEKKPEKNQKKAHKINKKGEKKKTEFPRRQKRTEKRTPKKSVVCNQRNALILVKYLRIEKYKMKKKIRKKMPKGSAKGQNLVHLETGKPWKQGISGLFAFVLVLFWFCYQVE